MITVHSSFLDIRQYAFGISVQSDEKSDSASAALSLCGIALNHKNSRQFRKGESIL